MSVKCIGMRDGVLMGCRMRYEDAESGEEIKLKGHLRPIEPGLSVEDGTGRKVRGIQLTDWVKEEPHGRSEASVPR